MSAVELKQLGGQAFAAGEYKKAAKLYRDAIKAAPSAVLYSNRAMCFVKLADWDRAVSDCKAGLALNPEPSLKVKLLWRHGVASKQLGRFKEAKEVFVQALGVDSLNLTVTAALREIEEEEGAEGAKRGGSFSGAVSIEDKRVKRTAQTATSDRVEVAVHEVEVLPLGYRTRAPPSPVRLVQVEDLSVASPTLPKTQGTPSGALTRPIEPPTALTFPQRPTVFFLQSLADTPAAHRSKAYAYVRTIEPEVYRTLFEFGGIDAGFMDLFLEAVLMEGVDHPTLAVLLVLSKCKRFNLGLSLCDENRVALMLSAVRVSSDPLATAVVQAWGG